MHAEFTYGVKERTVQSSAFSASSNASYFSSVLTLIWLFHHPPSIPLPVLCIFSAAVVVCKVCVSIIMRIQNDPVLFCTLPFFFPPFCCFYFINFSFLFFFPSASHALVFNLPFLNNHLCIGWPCIEEGAGPGDSLCSYIH